MQNFHICSRLSAAHCPVPEDSLESSEHRGVLRVLMWIFLSCPSLKHLDAGELSRYWRYLCPKRL